MRAAEYVRVSTDLQQYSIVNQQAAIADYAALHNFEIVKTYSDPAKSGLDIKHRPGLQSLLDDVLGDRADFQAVLVFDVSRWGRFQDSDEAACYEFLCKRAGISVHYCAEPFSNDGTPLSTLIKTIKRTMAAEYLRDLSAKVLAGQCRIAANGFKLGGLAGFGLRRLLLDSEGKAKTILRDGEEKHLATDRVTYTLGSAEEVAIVREIFSMYLDQDMTFAEIARALTERGIRNGRFGPWDTNVISRMLSHPKYTGCAAFNRRTQKLQSRRVCNPREQWVLRRGAFPAIVSQEVFDRTQAKLANRVHYRSKEQLLAELKAYIERHGTSLPRPKPNSGIASLATYAARFGGLLAAYELVGHRPRGFTQASLELRRQIASLRSDVCAEMTLKFHGHNLKVPMRNPIFRVKGRGRFRLAMGRCFQTASGSLRWMVTVRPRYPKHTLVVVRLQPANDGIKDIVVLSAPPRLGG